MRLRLALAVPLLALIACTGAGNGGSASATPTQHDGRSATFANWPTYHGNVARTGYAPSMVAASGAPRVINRYHLDDRVYASPIVIGGRIVVATENDTVYAIQDGKIVWHRHLGTPAPQSQLPCGNIFPSGITGTPAYSNGLVYVTPEFGGPPHHALYALRLSNGTVAWHRSLDLPGVATRAMQERGAVLVAAGRVWVPFGGLYGDCGDYKGRVIGIPADGTGATISYTVPTAREAGIWTPPGPSWGGQALFVSVGNGAATSPPWDHSDSVLKLGPHAHLLDAFAPSSWPSDNAGDADLGSQGPALVGKWIFIEGKNGTGYVLNRAHLGGIGGQVSSSAICGESAGGTAVVGSRVYVPCDDGIRAVRIDSTGHLHVVWHAASNIHGSAVVGGGRVWSLDPDNGRLYALNPATGQVVNSVAVGATSRFATPALFGRRVFVPTLTGMTVVITS